MNMQQQDELGVFPVFRYRASKQRGTYLFQCHLTPEDLEIRRAAVERTRNKAGRSSAFSFFYYSAMEVWK